MKQAHDPMDKATVAAADKVVGESIEAFLELIGEPRAVVVTAPAGAGKSSLVCRAVAAARKAKRRIVVGSPTNEQTLGLARRLADDHPKMTVSLLPATSLVIPDDILARGNLDIVDAGEANSASVVVATLAKLANAFGHGKLLGFDGMIIDESYQADASTYYGIGHLAPTHLLVGDGGQLSPFSTIKDADQWRGLDEDPLQTAVGVLLRNHPMTALLRMPISRRLDSRAVPIARVFYPSIEFGAAVKPGTRQLRLAATPKPILADVVLDMAADRGWAHLELADAITVSADPDIIKQIVRIVARLRERAAKVRCERFTSWTAPRIAVGVSHNDQKDQLRSALARIGRADVDVDTANKLQGLEYDVVIAWHPLAGLPEADEFHLDPGRLCVLLTRHRHACILIGRKGDRTLLNGVPPKSPAYVGWDHEPLLDGWDVHEEIFAALKPFRISS